jgi:hypothetical protein
MQNDKEALVVLIIARAVYLGSAIAPCCFALCLRVANCRSGEKCRGGVGGGVYLFVHLFIVSS